ncbi:hypothetical protein [Streptomyces sp. Root369]|uniref:hypothetical protein n=1 Tax=Streptomyces sp. Root369 TaxID=1736523 RepID=UPI000713C68C|nr:hypothetical protein [Streptomyces sp. Root369]KQW13308.1 hypothetical protein ASD08_32640 [Streptomyces sp. Root369]
MTDAFASLVAVVRASRETGGPVTARGGGTSMAGNAVGRAARRVADRVHTFTGALTAWPSPTGRTPFDQETS